jgi:hypothetical protein
MVSVFLSELTGIRLIIAMLVILARASLFLVYGVLLVFRPDQFLRVLEWLNPGDYVIKTASWRKDVHNKEWWFLGLAFILNGLFLLYVSEYS